MLTLRQLALAALISVLAYLLLFVLVVNKPITIGIVGDYMNHKIAYLAKHANEKKIVIFAGSNGRFSHRCETIEHIANVPCANMSVAAGYSLTWQLSHFQQYLRRGDVLYLPLETQSVDDTEVVGSEAPFMVAYSKADLLHLNSSELIHTLFGFDIRFLLSGLGEMALRHAGVKSRFSPDTLTPQGDERGNDDIKAVPYQDFVNHMPLPVLTEADFKSESNWKDAVQILDWASSRGVVVVGGLPTMVDEVHLPDDAIAFLRNLYAKRGQCFLVLPNESRYPRSYFYDGLFHLRESHQIAHSELLAPYLADVLRTGKCPSN
jgi:hypothetical protein